MICATSSRAFELDTTCGAFIRAFGWEIHITEDHVTSGTFFDCRRDGLDLSLWAGKFHVLVSRKRGPAVTVEI